MEPQLPSPNIGPEKSPSPSERVTPPLTGPESAPGVEQQERQVTREMQPSGPADPAPRTMPVAPPPLPQIQHAASDPQSDGADDSPATAADEDLIEKEWVEKAKKVIAETKHDPYLQEQAVSKLQADYLQKRYNKSVKVPSESS